MKRLRFVMIGGFLGAGKTTTMARLARSYRARNQRVGLVTNDQAQDLADTTSLRAQGLPVEEVPGACFCCRFDDLVDRVGRLESGQRPDVILAEPVGSCTDLVATVVQPLKDLAAKPLASWLAADSAKVAATAWLAERDPRFRPLADLLSAARDYQLGAAPWI